MVFACSSFTKLAVCCAKLKLKQMPIIVFALNKLLSKGGGMKDLMCLNIVCVFFFSIKMTDVENMQPLKQIVSFDNSSNLKQKTAVLYFTDFKIKRFIILDDGCSKLQHNIRLYTLTMNQIKINNSKTSFDKIKILN